MADRTTTSTVHLDTIRLISLGVAWAIIPEGRRAAVVRKEDGTWQYTLDSIVYSGFANSDAAIQSLANLLANEGILLRIHV
jgi:hypothetical protein